MQTIPLSQDQVALVDDQDHPLLSEFKWCYRGEKNKAGYAVRHIKVNGKDRLLYLHRQIAQPPEGMTTIFLNHDTLDCRRANLKNVTEEEARRHHRVRRDSKSGIKGVRYNPESDSYSAYVYRHGRAYHVGTYPTSEQASRAYQEELEKENPVLRNAPKAVERPCNPAPLQRSNPDGVCLYQGQ
jgi:AP2 domain